MLVLHHNQIRDISALGNLSQLKTLYLGHNLISDISALANLVQLKQLHLGRNQIRDISALKNLDQLQTLDLGNNQISDISALSGLQQLGWLSLTQNPITHISALFGLDRLEILYLINAPLLFVHEKDFDKITLKHNSLKLLSNKFHEISEHKCESNLSRFIQFIAMGNCGLEQIQEKFAELDPRDKNLIYGMVYQTAGSKSQDPQWGELHAFDDRSVFNRAVRKAISAKFDRLSQEEKNRVYGNICELAGHPATSDLQWGEEHAFENVLRLVDAMNRVPAPGV
ncbi:MAG: leucine-rich repeat domain-containing protein [Verrucomicrobia bacterium]|nr:leucine-rich repeat domain-containing protein [Verrucomicrobiota bacterium]